MEVALAFFHIGFADATFICDKREFGMGKNFTHAVQIIFFQGLFDKFYSKLGQLFGIGNRLIYCPCTIGIHSKNGAGVFPKFTYDFQILISTELYFVDRPVDFPKLGAHFIDRIDSDGKVGGWDTLRIETEVFVEFFSQLLGVQIPSRFVKGTLSKGVVPKNFLSQLPQFCWGGPISSH